MIPHSPVRFVDVQNNCLRISFPVPSTPKTQQQLGALGMVPLVSTLTFRSSLLAYALPIHICLLALISGKGLNAPAGEIPAASIEAKLMLTRQSLVILKAFAAMAGEKGEGAAAALGALEYLNRFAIDVEFKDLTNWVTQTAKIPPEALNPAQSIAMVQEKLKMLLAADAPPQKAAVKFLKVLRSFHAKYFFFSSSPPPPSRYSVS